MIVLNIFNFAANVGRELRTFFSALYYGSPYRGFSTRHIEFKYGRYMDRITLGLRRAENYSNNSKSLTKSNAKMRYDTHGGLFPYDSSG